MTHKAPARRWTALATAGLVLIAIAGLAACASSIDAAGVAGGREGAAEAAFAERSPEDEIIYFVMPDRFSNGDPSNDRGGIEGGRLEHGFDPTDAGFFHGGDLKGLTQKLDYIQGLGATAVWVGPVFENRPVQGAPDQPSAGYHGYWITDFLDVDPHLGAREDFKAFVDAAHARGMKVYMDIITNHTADVIAFRECDTIGGDDDPSAKNCPYRSIADYPWTRRGGLDGAPINEGFLGDDPAHLTPENFAKLTRFDWAYTPYVDESLKNVKNPAWLNDLRYYTHRGNTTFDGENSLYGDFLGLDDINTQHPDVVDGFVDIYSTWIEDFGVDGFRIDTLKHIRPEFWRAWTPQILKAAKRAGRPKFHMFGEAYEYEPARLAPWATEAGLPSVLDFPLQGAIRDVVAFGAPARAIDEVLQADPIYGEGGAVARRGPTFLGNHDMGRIAGMIRAGHPSASDAEVLARSRLAHAMMMFSRGVPILFYGDEQGMMGDGGDKGARESMFPTEVADYLDNDLIGTERGGADDKFDPEHPLYRAIAQMAAIRKAEPLLRHGGQVVRWSDPEGGLIVVSRTTPEIDGEIIVAFNAGLKPRSLNVVVDGRSQTWTSLIGVCRSTSNAAGSYALEVAPLDVVACKATR